MRNFWFSLVAVSLLAGAPAAAGEPVDRLAKAKVLAVEGGKVKLSAGKADNVRVGAEFEVTREGRPVGIVKVASVEDDFSLAAGEGEFRAGDDAGIMMRIGKVTCFRAGRRIEVEGKVCLQEGALEYLAVLAGGKEYESVLSFDCKATDLNIALIGMEYKAAGIKRLGDPETPRGDPLYLWVEWKTEDGKTKRVRAEDLLYNVGTKKPMRQTAWVFTGSLFERDPDTKRLIFLADIERNLIAVYRDPVAIFNSPLDTGVDGIYYQVNKEVCPKVGTPVKLVLEPAPKEALDPEKLKDGADLVRRAEGEERPPTVKPEKAPPSAKELVPGK
jgi:hypothetical protein